MNTQERILKLETGGKPSIMESKRQLAEAEALYNEKLKELRALGDALSLLRIEDAKGFMDTYTLLSSGNERLTKRGRNGLTEAYLTALAYLNGELRVDIASNKGAADVGKLRISYEEANPGIFSKTGKKTASEGANEESGLLNVDVPTIKTWKFDYTAGSDWDDNTNATRGQALKKYTENILDNLVQAAEKSKDYQMSNWDDKYKELIPVLLSKLNETDTTKWDWESPEAYNYIMKIAKSFKGADIAHWKSYFKDYLPKKVELSEEETLKASNFQKNLLGYSKDVPEGYTESPQLKKYLQDNNYTVVFKNNKPYIVKNDYSGRYAGNAYHQLNDNQLTGNETIGHGFYISPDGRLYSGNLLNVTDPDFYDEIAAIIGSDADENSEYGKRSRRYSYKKDLDGNHVVFNKNTDMFENNPIMRKYANEMHGKVVVDVSSYLGRPAFATVDPDKLDTHINSIGDFIFDDAVTVYYLGRNSNDIHVNTGTEMLSGPNGIRVNFGTTGKSSIDWGKVTNYYGSYDNIDIEQALKNAEERTSADFNQISVPIYSRQVYAGDPSLGATVNTGMKKFTTIKLNSNQASDLKLLAAIYLKLLLTLNPSITKQKLLCDEYMSRGLSKDDAIVKALKDSKDNKISLAFTTDDNIRMATLNDQNIKPLLIKDINRAFQNLSGNTLQEKLKQLFPKASEQEIQNIITAWQNYTDGSVPVKQEGGSIDKLTNAWHQKFNPSSTSTTNILKSDIVKTSINYNKLRR